MRSISIFVTFLIVLLIPSVSLNAVPASPFPINVSQPDGTVLTIRIHGDEFFNYKTTVDGYPIIQNGDGILTYAQMNTDGKLVSTSVKATNINKRSATEKTFIQNLSTNIDFSKLRQLGRAMRSIKSISQTSFLRAYPLTGSPKSLVILVNYKDLSFVTPNPKTAFTNLLNQKGYSTNGGTGSATDYFHDSSTGVFNPQFDVVGPFTLPQNFAYYGANDASGNDVPWQPQVALIFHNTTPTKTELLTMSLSIMPDIMKLKVLLPIQSGRIVGH